MGTFCGVVFNCGTVLQHPNINISHNMQVVFVSKVSAKAAQDEYNNVSLDGQVSDVIIERLMTS